MTSTARSLELAREALPCWGMPSCWGDRHEAGYETGLINPKHERDCPAIHRQSVALALDQLAREVRAETLEEARNRVSLLDPHPSKWTDCYQYRDRVLQALATEPGGEGR